MRIATFALAAALGLAASAAQAQQQGHADHHGAPSQPSAAGQAQQAAPAGAGHGMMRGMGGMMGGQPGQMMNCPMMQAGAAPAHAAAAGSPRGDQSVGSLALHAVNERMHREMAIEYTGRVDVDFARGMIAHHRGAIDMAKIVAAFGEDSKIRELAQSIILAQQDEIATMEAWLAQNAAQ